MIIPKGQGTTTTEKILADLCERVFLPLWSFPNVFRAPGKELCDLLAVSGNDIFVFSDKESALKLPHVVGSDGSMSATQLNRWMQRAVFDSADQLWRAERWIREHPNRMFCDRAAQTPLEIPCDTRDANIHLVLVANGARRAMGEFWREVKSPALMLNSELRGKEAHIIDRRIFPVGGAENPLVSGAFQVGDLDPYKPFIHIFDESGIRIVMKMRDTGPDMADYFTKREIIFRDGYVDFLAPEEYALLFEYLKYHDDSGHDFLFHHKAKSSPTASPVILDEARGHHKIHEELIRKEKADKVSYHWDSLIAHIAKEADDLLGGDMKARGLAIMASEPRVLRRSLGESFDKLADVLEGKRFMRLSENGAQGAVYVFYGAEIDDQDIQSEILGAACVLALVDRVPHSRMAIGIFRGPENMTIRCEHRDSLADDAIKRARHIGAKHRLFWTAKRYIKWEDEIPKN